jgi:hypothetical protein
MFLSEPGFTRFIGFIGFFLSVSNQGKSGKSYKSRFRQSSALDSVLIYKYYLIFYFCVLRRLYVSLFRAVLLWR